MLASEAAFFAAEQEGAMEPPAEGDIWEGGALPTRPASGAVHPRPSPLTHARASRDVCRRREAVPHGEGRR